MKYLSIALALTASLPMSAAAEMTTAEWYQPGFTKSIPNWLVLPDGGITHCVVGSPYMNGNGTICPEREGVDNSASEPEQEQEPECVTY